MTCPRHAQVSHGVSKRVMQRVAHVLTFRGQAIMNTSVMNRLNVIRNSTLHTTNLPPDLPINQVLSRRRPHQEAQATSTTHAISLHTKSGMFRQGLLRPMVTNVRPLRVNIPIIMTPTISHQDHLNVNFSSHSMNTTILQGRAIQHNCPIKLPNFRNVSILNATLSKARLPHRKGPLSQRFTRNMRLNTNHASLRTIRQRNRNHVTQRNQHSHGIRHRHVTTISRQRQDTNRQGTLQVTTRNTTRISHFITVNVNMNRTRTHFKQLLLSRITFSVKHTMGSNTINLHSHSQVLPTTTFRMSNHNTLNKAIIHNQGNSPLRHTTTSTFKKENQGPSNIFKGRNSPTTITTRHSLLKQNRATNRTSQVHLTSRVTIVIITTHHHRHHTPNNRRRGLVCSFRSFRFSNSRSFVSSDPSSNPTQSYH